MRTGRPRSSSPAKPPLPFATARHRGRRTCPAWPRSNDDACPTRRGETISHAATSLARRDKVCSQGPRLLRRRLGKPDPLAVFADPAEPRRCAAVPCRHPPFPAAILLRRALANGLRSRPFSLSCLPSSRPFPSRSFPPSASRSSPPCPTVPFGHAHPLTPRKMRAGAAAQGRRRFPRCTGHPCRTRCRKHAASPDRAVKDA